MAERKQKHYNFAISQSLKWMSLQWKISFIRFTIITLVVIVCYFKSIILPHTPSVLILCNFGHYCRINKISQNGGRPFGAFGDNNVYHYTLSLTKSWQEYILPFQKVQTYIICKTNWIAVNYNEWMTLWHSVYYN